MRATSLISVQLTSPRCTALYRPSTHPGEPASPIAVSDQTWATPRGVLHPDPSIIRSLERWGFDVNNTPHRTEHSIETQLPFLQTLNPLLRVYIVAISVDNMCSIQEANRLAQAIASVSDAYARETSEGISGSDRRYSPHTALYGYLPYMDI